MESSAFIGSGIIIGGLYAGNRWRHAEKTTTPGWVSVEVVYPDNTFVRRDIRAQHLIQETS
jgi:hypothetical protein